MKIELIDLETKKTKKIKFGFNWIIFGFAEIYAIPFFIYRLYIFGVVFLITSLACMYFGAPYYDAFIADPLMLIDLDKTLPFYTPGLVISSIINLALLVMGGVYGNRLIAKKYLKRGWKINEQNEKIVLSVKEKWKLSDDDFINHL